MTEDGVHILVAKIYFIKFRTVCNVTHHLLDMHEDIKKSPLN